MNYEKIFLDEIERCKKLAGGDEGVLTKIESKREHSLRVVAMGKKILTGKEEAWDRETALACLLLHDIGRFEQSLKNSLSDKQTGINHARLGADILEKMGLPEIVIEAVEQHNNPHYTGKNIYAHLVREADQLVIMSEWKSQIAWRKDGPISDYARENWEKGEVIDWRNCNDLLKDWVLMVWSWVRKFRYQETKNLFGEMGMEEKFRAVLGEEVI